MLREILKIGDETLTKKSRPVTDFNQKLFDLLDDMHETLLSVGGIGLAAPQVSILRRLFIIHLDDKQFEFINPEIIKTEGEYTPVEGCLSVPGVFGTVKRPIKTTVKFYDRHGDLFELTGEEIFSQAINHEYDHLNGKLFKNSIIEIVEPDEDK